MKVWLLTSGTGADGDEWSVESIHSTEEGAERERQTKDRPDFFNIEEWNVKEDNP